MVVLDADGEVIDEISGHGAGEREAFVAPFDVATDDVGRVYVLDADAAQISIFDVEGAFIRNLPSDPALLERARGIDVDGEGNIWVAHTPGARIVGLTLDGELIREFPVWPGKDAQPVDVLVASDGDLYVTDAGLHKLIRYDRSSRRLLAWDIPIANSVDGSHLAKGDDGRIYVTIPELGQVWILDPVDSQIEKRSIIAEDNRPVKPVGIDVAADGTIVVADTNGGRVLKLSK